MLFDPTKKICTRDGRNATILSDHNNVCVGLFRYPIYAEIQHPTQASITIRLRYMENGQLKSGSNITPHDLINHEIWHDWLHDIYWANLAKEAKAKFVRKYGEG